MLTVIACIYILMPLVNTKHDIVLVCFMYPMQDILRQLNGSDCGVFVTQVNTFCYLHCCVAVCILLASKHSSGITCNKITKNFLTFIMYRITCLCFVTQLLLSLKLLKSKTVKLNSVFYPRMAVYITNIPTG